jgi:hypothetical protein
VKNLIKHLGRANGRQIISRCWAILSAYDGDGGTQQTHIHLTHTYKSTVSCRYRYRKGFFLPSTCCLLIPIQASFTINTPLSYAVCHLFCGTQSETERYAIAKVNPLFRISEWNIIHTTLKQNDFHSIWRSFQSLDND